MPPETYKYMLRYYPVSSRVKMDIHHAVFDKGLMMGMPLEARKKMHNPLNLLWIANKDNASHANVPSRQEAYRILSERFGEDMVVAYVVDMLKLFKTQPFTLSSLQGE